MPRTPVRINNIVPKKNAFCKHGTTREISISLRLFPSSSEIVPDFSTIVGTATPFTIFMSQFAKLGILILFRMGFFGAACG